MLPGLFHVHSLYKRLESKGWVKGLEDLWCFIFPRNGINAWNDMQMWRFCGNIIFLWSSLQSTSLRIRGCHWRAVSEAIMQHILLTPGQARRAVNQKIIAVITGNLWWRCWCFGLTTITKIIKTVAFDLQIDLSMIFGVKKSIQLTSGQKFHWLRCLVNSKNPTQLLSLG